jgi:hypothetical protein
MTQTLMVATRKGLFHLTRSARDAFQVKHASFIGDPVSMVLHDPRDNKLYAGISHGHFGCKLHRSDDSGATWTEIAAPAYPPKPEGLEDVNSMGKAIPWNVELIWSLTAGGADEPGALWCGTIPGGLFRSSDHGQSWELCMPLWSHPTRKEWFGGGYDYPGIHSISVDPRDSRRVLVGVSCGGVWLTEDRGETWQPRTKGMYASFMPPERREDPNIQDPHRVVRCQGAPDHLWTQHHNGVFRSRDDGATWQDVTTVTPSTFGFAMAVHPRNPDIAWLVPAESDQHRIPAGGRMCVARTRDGGASFEELGRGLPQEYAYDLIYRHALVVDNSGDCLAMGSTTGSLWISTNQGDEWAVVNNHLPPIAALSWAG